MKYRLQKSKMIAIFLMPPLEIDLLPGPYRRPPMYQAILIEFVSYFL